MKLVTRYLVTASVVLGLLGVAVNATAMSDSEVRDIPIQRLDSGNNVDVETDVDEVEVIVDDADKRDRLKQRLEKMRDRIEHKVGRDLDLSLDALSRDVAVLAAESEHGIVVDQNLDQLIEYALTKQAQESSDRFYTNVLIPVVSIISVFFVPVFIVGLVLFFRHRRRQLVASSLANIVAQAPDVPVDTLEKIQSLIDGGQTPQASVSDVRDLRRGAFLSVVGGVCIISQLLQGDVEGTWFGLLLLGLGLVYLYLYKNRPITQQID